MSDQPMTTLDPKALAARLRAAITAESAALSPRTSDLIEAARAAADYLSARSPEAVTEEAVDAASDALFDSGIRGDNHPERSAIQAALSAALPHLLPAPSPVTEGWVLVPREPTPEMRRAFHHANEKIDDADWQANAVGSPDYQWAAMLAAAPRAQEVGNGE